MGLYGDALEMLDEREEAFKRLRVDPFDDHCNFGLYGSKYNLFDHILEDLRKIGTLSVVHSSPYDRFEMHIKHSYRRTSKTRKQG